MSLVWKTCSACNGYGETLVMKSRIHLFNKKIDKPILKDETKKCPICKGIGKVYIKTFPLNPWFKPFRKDN